MSVNHYENFPVASILLPKHLRPAVETIYAFARNADDIADEGDATPGVRLELLESYETALKRIESRLPAESALFQSLDDIICNHHLPLQPFRDLLSAFKQDVVTTRYANFDALLDYCRRSANPVGTLMLHLYGEVTEQNLRDSNAICTALQLINFWQDVAVDWQKDRIYLPQEDMTRFKVGETQIKDTLANEAWRSLMQFEVERTKAMMLSGAGLPLRLPGRIGWELRMVVQGGLRILEWIEAADYDIFRKRPKLKFYDWCVIGWRALNS